MRKINLSELLKADKIVLDTSVIAEYIIENSPFKDTLKRLFYNPYKNNLYVNLVTLSETLYIAERIYRLAGLRDSNEKALEFVSWVKNRTRIISIDEELAINAGEIKKKLRLSLSDSFAISTGIKIGAKILFKGLEKEMIKYEEELRKLGVIFLEDIIHQ